MYGIFAYIWLMFMVHVGKYISPMDPMGYKLPIPPFRTPPPAAPHLQL